MGVPNARAQEATPAVALEEVVVTAQRREENLQKAAVAVSAVAGDTLTKASVTQATDLTRLDPGCADRSGGVLHPDLSARCGYVRRQRLRRTGVAFNLDGVYLSRPAAPAGLFST
ncbi:hypothetical protein ACRAWD_32015 [Caulobacter segnis]